MEAFATLKQFRFFIGESLVSPYDNIELHNMLKTYQEHEEGITMVADGCLGLT